MASAAVDAHAELGQAEARVVRGDHEVARRRDRETGAECGAGDRADDGHRALLDREERLAHVEHALTHVVAVHAREVVEVVPAAEVLAGPGEHDGAHARADLVDVDEEVAQLAVHEEIDRVDRRSVHGHGCDAVALDGGGQTCVGHGGLVLPGSA